MALRSDARLPIAAGQGVAARRCACPQAGAFGAEPNDLVGIAVAIELMHNAFLVHDDIADGSEMRRGRPTLATTYGTGRGAQCR